jgi:hypothetical protein
MSPMGIGLALFVVVDAVVVYVVLKRVLERRAGLRGAGLGEIARFAHVAAEETKLYMEANYGGDPSTLPGALSGLVDRLAERAGEQGMSLDRDTLKQFAATAVVSLRLARSGDVRAALASVS